VDGLCCRILDLEGRCHFLTRVSRRPVPRGEPGRSAAQRRASAVRSPGQAMVVRGLVDWRTVVTGLGHSLTDTSCASGDPERAIKYQGRTVRDGHSFSVRR